MEKAQSDDSNDYHEAKKGIATLAILDQNEVKFYPLPLKLTVPFDAFTTTVNMCPCVAFASMSFKDTAS